MENINNCEYVSLIDILKILKKKLAFIVIITVLCTGIAAIKCIFFMAPIYEASTTALIVKGDNNNEENREYTQNDILLYEKMVSTYKKIAESNLVIDKTAEEIKSYSSIRIRSMVTAVSQGQTQIIELKVKDKNKEEAANIANIYCKNFIEQSMKILPVGKIEVLDPAKIPIKPIYPNSLLMIGVSFILGLIISTGMVLFKHYIDSNKIINEKQIIGALNMPVLIVIE